MNTTNTKKPPIPKEIIDDMEKAVALILAGKHDASFEKRIHSEAQRIRQRVLRKHGVLNIGTPAIRELRDG